jgi:hypothetical protein
MPKYNKDSLRNGIENCRKNIQIFEDAIRKEKQTIQEYSFYISEILKKEKEVREQEEAECS